MILEGDQKIIDVRWSPIALLIQLVSRGFVPSFSSLAHEIDQRHRYGIIGQRDDRIGYHVQPDDARIPLVAHPVRHEPFCGEETLKETHAYLH